MTNLTFLAAQTVHAKMVHFCITNIGIDENGQEKTPNKTNNYSDVCGGKGGWET